MQGSGNQEKQRKKRFTKEGEKEGIEKKSKRRGKRERIRLIPIWLRIIIVFVLVSISLMAGMMFGYGVLGNGDPVEALNPGTWKHILDIINAVE